MSLSIYFSTQRTHSRLTRSCLRCTHSPHYGFTLHTTPLPVLRVHGNHLLCVRALRKASHTQHTASHSHPCIAHSPSHAQLPCRYAPEVSMRARADKSSSTLQPSDEYRIACAQPRAIIGSRASVSSHTTRIACAHTPTHRMALYPPHTPHTHSRLSSSFDQRSRTHTLASC